MKRPSLKEAGDEEGGTAPGGIQALDAALSVLRVLRSFDGPANSDGHRPRGPDASEQSA